MGYGAWRKCHIKIFKKKVGISFVIAILYLLVLLKFQFYEKAIYYFNSALFLFCRHNVDGTGKTGRLPWSAWG